jgi:hypothetical protein
MRKVLLSVALCALLPACGVGSNGLPVLSGKAAATAQTVATIIVTDVTNADAAAVAGNDAAAHQCFGFLKTYVPTLAASLTQNGTPVTGVVSGFEAARLAYRSGQAAVSQGIPDVVSQNCGWLAASVGTDINGLLLQLASKAAPAVGLPSLP